MKPSFILTLPRSLEDSSPLPYNKIYLTNRFQSDSTRRKVRKYCRSKRRRQYQKKYRKYNREDPKEAI